MRTYYEYPYPDKIRTYGCMTVGIRQSSSTTKNKNLKVITTGCLELTHLGNHLTLYLIMMGWDYVSELLPPTGILFVPGWYVSMVMVAGVNSWLIHQNSLAVLPAETSGTNRENGRRSENFAYDYLKYLKGFFTCRKILRHGTSGFTSHPKEDVLWIFIALNNPSPRPDSNPWPLGAVASTLTTTPPRRLPL
jgi:hypothetical protein